MSALLHLIFGFIAAFIGVIPPGLLNITAARISLNYGRKSAAIFAFGVVTTVMLQTLIALLFAKYLDQHPEIVHLLRQIAVGIFICLTVYFFFIAKDSRRKPPAQVKKSGLGRFFLGMFLAAINLLTLPYWVYVSITFNGFGWFEFSSEAIIMCVLGSALGTLTMLIVYIQFFKHLKSKNHLSKINMNYVIGTITGAIAILTFVRILNDIL